MSIVSINTKDILTLAKISESKFRKKTWVKIFLHRTGNNIKLVATDYILLGILDVTGTAEARESACLSYPHHGENAGVAFELIIDSKAFSKADSALIINTESRVCELRQGGELRKYEDFKILEYYCDYLQALPDEFYHKTKYHERVAPSLEHLEKIITCFKKSDKMSNKPLFFNYYVHNANPIYIYKVDSIYDKRLTIYGAPCYMPK